MVWDITPWKIKVLNPNKWRFGSDDFFLSIGWFFMFYFVDFRQCCFCLHFTPPQKTNQCTLKRGHFKRKVIFHPPIFWRHVSFPWSKLPSLPLFAQLVCVCVISFHHQFFIRGYDFISPERIPTKRFCFFHSSFGRLCSIFLNFLGFVTALWGFKLYGVFFSKFFWWCSYSSYKQHSFI